MGTVITSEGMGIWGISVSASYSLIFCSFSFFFSVKSITDMYSHLQTEKKVNFTFWKNYILFWTQHVHMRANTQQTGGGRPRWPPPHQNHTFTSITCPDPPRLTVWNYHHQVCRRGSWPARVPSMLRKPPACLWDNLWSTQKREPHPPATKSMKVSPKQGS